MVDFVRQLVIDGLPTPPATPTRFPYGSMRMPQQPRLARGSDWTLADDHLEPPTSQYRVAPMSITTVLLVFACCFTFGFAIALVAIL